MVSDAPVSSSPANITAAQRLAHYNATIGHGYLSQAIAYTEEEATMRKLFSIRSAHLPGNNCCQDWIQHMKNNHPLFGLCCRHRLNPIGFGHRLVLLLASVSFGLVAINLVYLFYDYHDTDGVLLEIMYKPDANDQGSIIITYRKTALWTIGGVLHSFADLGMWYLTACTCCLPGSGCHKRCGFLGKVGPYVAAAVAAFLSAAATCSILLRASDEASNGKVNDMKDDTWKNIRDVESFSFLLAYLSELGIVYFCWHPLLSTIFCTIWPLFPWCLGSKVEKIQQPKDEAKIIAQERGDDII